MIVAGFLTGYALRPHSRISKIEAGKSVRNLCPGATIDHIGVPKSARPSKTSWLAPWVDPAVLHLPVPIATSGAQRRFNEGEPFP